MSIPNICWLAAFVVLLALEVATVGLASLRFTVGSLRALFTSLLAGNIWTQFVVFLAMSFLCLVIIRPLAKKYADPCRVSTNADRIIDAEGVVTQVIDNPKARGQITANGAPWTARIEEGCPAIPAGSRVRVPRTEGVKVIVSPLPVPTPGR